MSSANSTAASFDPNDYFGYKPDFAVNVTATVLFGILMIIQFGLSQFFRSTWLRLFFALGAAVEFVGFIGRVLCTRSSGSPSLWRMQVVMLGIGPSFMARGLYYQFSKVITVFGTRYAPMRPNRCSIVLIVADLVGMIVVIGGASSTQTADGAGRRVALGGICVQFATLILFTAAFGIVLARIFTDGSTKWDPTYEWNRRLPLFKLWIPALVFSDLALIICYIYRLLQAALGLSSAIQVHERYFLILDALMVLLSLVAFTTVYPPAAHGDVFVQGFDFGKRKKKSEELLDETHSSITLIQSA